MTVEDFDKIDLHGQDIRRLDAKMMGLKKCLWCVSGIFGGLLVAAVAIGLTCDFYNYDDYRIRLLYCFIAVALIVWGVIAFIIRWEMKQIFPIIRSLSDNREKLRSEVFLSTFRSEMLNNN